ncbi:hypothetical protein C0J52_24030, partial [Blattella germanica]
RISLHDNKVGVWCADSDHRIVGPKFHYQTVNSAHYVDDVLKPFFNMPTEEENQYAYF